MTKQKQVILCLFSLLFCFSLLSCTQAKEGQKHPPQANNEKQNEIKELTSPTDKLSYALGMQFGNSLKNIKTEISLPILLQAAEAQFHGQETLITLEEASEIQRTAFRRLQEEVSTKSKAEGIAFLNENKQKEGIIVTKSGLQYQVLKEGDGPMPKATDKVKVHYKGSLVDGTEFDSSIKRDQPATFAANRVIRGWTEALQLMKVGSKYRLFIPSDLAYGQRGSPPKIPPNATLIFEVELLEIIKKQEPKKPEEKEPEPKK